MPAVAEPTATIQHLENYVSGAVAQAVTQTTETNLPSQDELREALDRAVIQGIETALSSMAERYAANLLGAERHERAAARQGYRSGVRTRRVWTPVGRVEVKVVKSRAGALTPPWLADARRFAEGVRMLGRRLWTYGLSTRKVADLSEDVLGEKASHASVATWVQEAADEVLRWLNRPVRDDIVYLVLDGLYVPVKRETAAKEPVLVAMGITASGHKEILDVLVAPSESYESWRTLLTRLRGRGLPVDKLRLVVTDGNEGLLQALAEELPNVPRQRCTVHKVRNVVGKCPKHLKGEAPKEASEIWKAPNRAEARRRAKEFIVKYRSTHGVLANIVEEDLEATLTFYDLDSAIWHTMRSTNVMERANREFKRRFRDIGAHQERPGKDASPATTRTAVLIAIKLNDDWENDIVRGFKPRRRKAR